MSSKRRFALTEVDAQTIRIALLYLINAAKKDGNLLLAAKAQEIYDKLTNYEWRKD